MPPSYSSRKPECLEKTEPSRAGHQHLQRRPRGPMTDPRPGPRHMAPGSAVGRRGWQLAGCTPPQGAVSLRLTCQDLLRGLPFCRLLSLAPSSVPVRDSWPATGRLSDFRVGDLRRGSRGSRPGGWLGAPPEGHWSAPSKEMGSQSADASWCACGGSGGEELPSAAHLPTCASRWSAPQSLLSDRPRPLHQGLVPTSGHPAQGGLGHQPWPWTSKCPWCPAWRQRRRAQKATRLLPRPAFV